MSNRALIYSSITKKIVIAVAGLFLVSFLLVHLGINLLMLRSDGGVMFTEAVQFMTTNPVIKVFELVLFGGFFIHILFGIILQIYNWIARPKRYKVEGFSHTSFFSKYMIHTGAIIFVFLAIHFTNFYFVKLELVEPPAGVSSHDFYTMAQLLFSSDFYTVLYIILMVFLGFHLQHAFQSAFQTLGLAHGKYTPVVKVIGTIYAIAVPAGFALIPVYFMFFK